MIFLSNLRYQVIKFIENIPVLQIFIYNNLSKFKFLFPHDKDYFALKLLFRENEKRDFIDVGGNIGLSAIGFRELGFKNNQIHIFEPDTFLVKNYIDKLSKFYKNLFIYNFGLHSKNCEKKLVKAFYENNYFHFNNSFDKSYIKNKIKSNYPEKYKKFKYKSQKFKLKNFDNLGLKNDFCFVKIDVEGLDHEVLKGMKKFLKKSKPVILIEYNYSNFKIIYNQIKKDYLCYKFDMDKNMLKRLTKSELKILLSGNILENKYAKNSVNIFYIHKSYNFLRI